MLAAFDWPVYPRLTHDMQVSTRTRNNPMWHARQAERPDALAEERQKGPWAAFSG